MKHNFPGEAITFNWKDKDGKIVTTTLKHRNLSQKEADQWMNRVSSRGGIYYSDSKNSEMAFIPLANIFDIRIKLTK